MPLYRALGNVQHNDLVIKKGDVVELPEGEKSDRLVLVAAPVKEPEPARAPACDEEHTPAEAPKSKGATSSKK